MKILHTADWHLDAPFAWAEPELRRKLRREQLLLPEKITEIALAQGCDVILIAGDVFDGPYTPESYNAVYTALKNCGLPVFISPGNHDYVAEGSAWLQERWSENVHVFAGNLESVVLPELSCRIYGAGYRSMDCQALLEGFRAEGPEEFHIAVLHGDPGTQDSPYCPISTAQVRDSGLDYLALGHIHKAGSFIAGDTLCLWPGCPMGRGFDETGKKGVYTVELSPKAAAVFHPLNTTCFYDLEADTTGGTVPALERLLPAAPSEDIYRVRLTGCGEGALGELYGRFAHVPNLVLTDFREAPVDLWGSAGEDTLEGVYFAMLRELAESDDPALRGQALQAAAISRRLLDGKEVRL